ncbi:hypothetical protein [Anaerocolumna xylanovorans]|uniref:DUF2442 domain-containing protein n=1 Tax=Anaerocolumna xylanovorans DSM 12503 TaxID=1121345 RepID=A0A1M7XWK9_9FIRM|nr:hypothetical protein [Anaerocolumna xylanovorans]SHO43178.1 hypothetical protein SAMN02745217_00119 [Anaerocolumna xylanovorans DSM 12503]
MLQITRVDIIDGQTLDIELSNGHLILFDTQRLPETDHSYDSLRDLEVLPRPSTDGQSIFWRDGPRLALGDILRWLTVQKNNE